MSAFRRPTRAVNVGATAVGGGNPIRVQSMCTTDTLDTAATVAQTLRMVEAGCEIVRITAPTAQAARNLGAIKDALRERGCGVPLVADIHFKPDAAMTAAGLVEKVRINPGNFVDSKRFLARDYSDAEYAEELARIEAAFTPLVQRLKRLGGALRIGTNHGSLSDRILNRFGDTPLGMVESALEFLRIARKLDYHDIILSMKASNPKVMIAAYRLLDERMRAEGMDYPLHLGVTEAGDGEDGRIKSAIGIGTLLSEGLGDTIRVSLTEDPELEVPVAFELAAPYQPGAGRSADEAVRVPAATDYARRAVPEAALGPIRLGAGHPVRAALAVPRGLTPNRVLEFLEARFASGDGQEPELLIWEVADAADLDALRAARLFLESETRRVALLARAADAALGAKALESAHALCFGGAPTPELLAAGKPVIVEAPDAETALARAEGAAALALSAASTQVLIREYRALATRTALPLHVRAANPSLLESATLIGGLLCDGIGDSCEVPGEMAASLRLQYNILQGAGVRITKTEFVSCPSCGRTLFDLQETTERIKAKTGHLKGVKIAIMGCIVNGPGEMADADFGYVGGAPDRINLYVGKECVKKGVPTAEADAALIALIKHHGKWVEPVRA